MTRFALITALIACLPAGAQVEELFSSFVQVFYPQGEYARKLVRLEPPPKEGWKALTLQDSGCRLLVPEKTEPNLQPAGSRVLELVLSAGDTTPRPTLRVDSFRPEAGEPTTVDAPYVRRLVEDYPRQAFMDRFTVTDSGLVVLGRKTRLAMVGGRYTLGAAPVYRVQWTYLSRERQLFFTFDCAEADWDRHADVLGRILLSVSVSGRPPVRKGKSSRPHRENSMEPVALSAV